MGSSACRNDDSSPTSISRFISRVFFSARQALSRHATGGNILILATILAFIAANVPWIRDIYSDFWQQQVRLQIGGFNVFSHNGEPMTVLEFMNVSVSRV